MATQRELVTFMSLYLSGIYTCKMRGALVCVWILHKIPTSKSNSQGDSARKWGLWGVMRS